MKLSKRIQKRLTICLQKRASADACRQTSPIDNLLRQLWRDESGVVWTIELVLTATIVTLGTIVGLVTFRDALVQELGDLAAASSQLDQSYEYSAAVDSGTIGSVTFDYAIAGSGYTDNSNFCEPGDPDPAGDAPMCIVFQQPADEVQ